MAENLKEAVAEFKKEAATMPEAGIFIMLTSMGEMLKAGTESHNDGKWVGTEEEYVEGKEYYTALYNVLLGELYRFGVDPAHNGDFAKWEDFWEEWEASLTDEQVTIIDVLLSEDKPVDEYVPKIKWNDPVVA